MPHLILETTADLPENAHVPDILERLVTTLAGQETIDPRSIKAYHTLRSVWVMGEGAPAGFAHLTLAVLSGRDQDLRRRIGEALLQVLREEFADSLAEAEVAVTLEVREMERETYFRG